MGTALRKDCLLQLNVTYDYRFFLQFLFGDSGPSISLSSTATSVSQ